jgi:hypothetical protein
LAAGLRERGPGVVVAWSGGTFLMSVRSARRRRYVMNGIIYLVGLVVVVLFILSFLGLR